MRIWLMICVLLLVDGSSGNQVGLYDMINSGYQVIQTINQSDIELIESEIGDEMISLDDREWISGLIGFWPDYILEDILNISKGSKFVVRIPYVLSEHERIKFTPQLEFEMHANKSHGQETILAFDPIVEGDYDFIIQVLDKNNQVMYESTYKIIVKANIKDGLKKDK